MKLKLKITNQGGKWYIKSPTHHYTLFYHPLERAWQVNYLDLHTNKRGVTYKRDIDEAMEWVVNVHIPAKMKAWFYV